MSVWLVLLLAGVLLLGGTLAYAAFKWRRAPKVYRAMNWMVAMSTMAGLMLAVSLTHWAGMLPWSSSSKGEGSTWGHFRDAIEGECPAAGVPAREVGKDLVLADEQHASDPNWVSNQTQAELCETGLEGTGSQLCVETFIARHALGLDLTHGDHRTFIPCEEVAEFCDNHALDKDSTLCKRAYRTRNARLSGGT
jgi:hypothetical protein